jgi:hypothetical protein
MAGSSAPVPAAPPSGWTHHAPALDVLVTMFHGTASLLAACGCPHERPRRYSQAPGRPDQAFCLLKMFWAIEVFSPSAGMIAHAAR